MTQSKSKADLWEDAIEKVLQIRYTHVERTSSKPYSGDFIYKMNGKSICADAKCYGKNVSGQFNKLIRDMIHVKADGGAMYAPSTLVSHNNKSYEKSKVRVSQDDINDAIQWHEESGFKSKLDKEKIALFGKKVSSDKGVYVYLNGNFIQREVRSESVSLEIKTVLKKFHKDNCAWLKIWPFTYSTWW